MNWNGAEYPTEPDRAYWRRSVGGGEWPGGPIPLGYAHDAANKRLVAHPMETPLVKSIFRCYVYRRLGAKTIARDLNDRGIRTRNGRYFSVQAVIAIITNPLYAGKIRWGEEVFPGRHEPLVRESTFEQAQAILTERRGDPALRRSNATDYPFSGLLRCARCGRPLVGLSAHGRSNIYHYYGCPGKFKYGECDLENLTRHSIDRALISQIQEVFSNEGLISGLLERINTKRIQRIPRKKGELQSIEKRLGYKREIIQRYWQAFESGRLDAASCNERLKEIEGEIFLLGEQKTGLEREIARSRLQPLTFDEIRKVVDKLEDVILSGQPSQRRAFLRTVVKTVIGRNAIRYR